MEVMRDAIKTFYQPANMRSFMLDVMNGSHTPFIVKLSEINQKSPSENAVELSVSVNDFVASSYRTLKHFGVNNEGKTLDEYIHKNERSVRRTVNFLFADLEGKLTPGGFCAVISTILQPYMQEKLAA